MATTPRKKSAPAKKAADTPKKPASAAKTAASSKEAPPARKSPASKTKAAPAAATPVAAKKAAPATKAAAAPNKRAAKSAEAKAPATRKEAIDASKPIGDGPVWDGDPDKIPEYKADNDIVSAVISQFRLIRGIRGKIRAVGVILLRLLP